MVSCIVADDDHNIANALCALLNLIGVDILAIGNNGKELVKMYKKHHPDLVFTDLNMPKYDGFYAIMKIKDMNPDAKIVAVTGDSTASESPLLDSLKVPVINKPFNMNALKQVIADACLIFNVGPTPFKIQYKFKEDDKFYSCIVTYDQYRNLRRLPIIQECEIVNNDQKNIKAYQNEMQKAIELAAKNETSRILKLSEIVS